MANMMDMFRTATIALLLTLTTHAQGDQCCYPEIIECDCSPSSSPTSCGTGYIRGEALYLRADEGGLSKVDAACIINEIDCSCIEITEIKSHSQTPKFQWNWGYRVAAGLKCDPWEIAALWTCFTQGSDHLDCHKKDSVKWKLDLNYVDLLVGYRFCSNSSWSTKVFGGLRGAFINQKLHSRFAGHFQGHSDSDRFRDSFCVSFEDSSDSCGCDHSSGSGWLDQTLLNNQTGKEKFKGLGGLLGLEANWDLGCGVHFFILGDFGCMYGHYDTHFCLKELQCGEIVFNSERKKQHAGQFFVDSSIGLRWKFCICNTIKLNCQLAFEQHTFFNHNQIGRDGNLNLYGGNFGVGLEF